MDIVGNYREDGYALFRGLVSPEIAREFLHGLKDDLVTGPLPVSEIQDYPNLLTRPAFEVYGHHYRPMLYFLWGLTPMMCNIVGKDLLPTYNYFRIYREGDVCRVHSDRYSCEHSLSLTLDYSDGVPWPLEFEKLASEPSSRVEADFGGADFGSTVMDVGDAVIYRGVNHRHGRTSPNPNMWSAHLFLHWVDRSGPYRDHAFDGREREYPVAFSFV